MVPNLMNEFNHMLEPYDLTEDYQSLPDPTAATAQLMQSAQAQK